MASMAADMDVALAYDAFSINIVLFPEDPGFCDKGEGGALMGDGRIVRGGPPTADYPPRRALLLGAP